MLYNDRGMKKWQGMILSEHRVQIKEDANQQAQVIKEQMSAGQIADILQDSFKYGKKIDIQLNQVSNGLYKNITGTVGGFFDGLVYISTSGGLEDVDPETIRHVSKSEHKKWYE